MKKTLVLFLLLGSCLSLYAQNVKKVVVKSKIKGCWAAVISEEEAKAPENEYGWWSAWQKIKEAKKYKTTPATFTNLPKGKYIIVIYNPASQKFDPNAGIPGQASDGVVLEEVDIQGDQTFTVEKGDFKDWNCLSCPWLYVWNGKEFVRQSEVIKDVVGKTNEKMTSTSIAPACMMGQILKIRIQEEKDEISFLNQVVLKINDQLILPQNQKALENEDDSYISLKKGESIELEFIWKEAITSDTKIELFTRGYYEPDRKFLSEIYQKYLKTK
ncbi:MAG: hypothetical protein NW226_21905 [Microscillaceae bacterium]|nr:hypothetical protein [Microscillaceae bacterium]